MILNLLRVEDLKVEDMIKRSFSEYDAQKDTAEVEKLLVRGRKKLSQMPPLVCEVLLRACRRRHSSALAHRLRCD